MKKYLKYLLIIIPLIGGIVVSTLLNFDLYKEINLPPLAPPRILFPIVWTILYLLLGVVLYRIRYSDTNRNLFITQLIINYGWCFFFFTFKTYLLSFIIIFLLDLLVFYLILSIDDKISKYILIGYFVWLVFASYLNFSIYLLN